jgi:lipoic acid synthetase
VLRRRHLGRISFAEANDFQRALLQSGDDYILVFEHPPTYTRGIRTMEEHFLVPPESLNAVVIDADRGGDVTYHAPGQVVAWAIVTVADDPSAGKVHVTRLEDAVIATVRHFDPDRRLGRVDRLDGYPGVWADVDGVPCKIAAVGVRTERNALGLRRTLHGVALNVDIDMEGFKAIVPCGIADKPVASMSSLGLEVSALDVDERLGVELEDRLGGAAAVARVERSAASVSAERPLLRRLRKAGVDPDAGVPIHSRKPEWLRIDAHMGEEYQSLRTLTEDLRLVTVCEEAGCPNIFECWSAGTATFMVNGERCTRACGFCLIDTRKPFALDPSGTGARRRGGRALETGARGHHVRGARRPRRRGSRGDRRDDPRDSRALARDERRGPHERPQGRRRVAATDLRRGAPTC